MICHDCYVWTTLILDNRQLLQPPRGFCGAPASSSLGLNLEQQTTNSYSSYSIQDVTIKWQSKTHMTYMAKTLRHGVQKSHMLCATIHRLTVDIWGAKHCQCLFAIFAFQEIGATTAALCQGWHGLLQTLRYASWASRTVAWQEYSNLKFRFLACRSSKEV